MKALLASTAVVLALGGPALAQDTGGFMNAPAEGDIYASNLMGMDVFVTDKDVTNDMSVTQDQLADGWNDIGDVGDVLISQDGQVKAVVLDVGGFLGMGEHTIAVEMSHLHFVHDQNDRGAIFIAMKGTKESLEAAPEFDRGDMTDQTTAEVTTPAATPPAAGTIADRWNRPAMQREGYQDVPLEQVTAETLTGATVYGPDDQSVGEVRDLLVGSDDKISARHRRFRRLPGHGRTSGRGRLRRNADRPRGP